MKIRINTIPHEEQRYPTVGDWQIEPPDTPAGEELLKIKVSKLSDWRREVLVAVHELVEVLLCKHAGVTAEQVDEFDMNFEANRDKDFDDSEPGDDPSAPYVKQHAIATSVERMLAAELDVNWRDYERELNELP